ncbi:MAG: hypothetical protein A2V90_02675 [Gammaproteobacteria bacterium RBG_16_57_12]|nr:MAG: hypothetical protein A2V90_02675 [Gammaproteobacteria bacterium RBG_16_57_12]
MKLLCDEMLKRLGRWLRAAGYDTVLDEDGTTDRELIERAQREGRWLITRDAKLMEYRHARQTVVLLLANSVEDCALELRHKLAIDWLYRPFSRCLECNATLVVAAAQEDLARVPREALARGTEVFRCSGCQRLYWQGSHVRRMRAKLEKWAKISEMPKSL